MDAYALYLPQFHRIPENDLWWGDGFTEWDSVRNAEPIYRGHVQPVHPLDGDYYDLTDSSVLVRQAKLARDYGVSGFVFFHYWYSGKRLLEKPVELWLDTPEADAGFCLCWANHPWTRSWDGKEHEILQAQTYGGEEDWAAHLDYLLPFFRDQRYRLIEGRPVLFLYNAGAVPDVDRMVEYWDRRLIELGFAGIYLVEYVSTKNPSPACASSRAVYEDEPLYSLRFEISAVGKANRVIRKWLKLPDYQDYRKVWELMLGKTRTYPGRSIIQGAFVAWDNSPRRGRRGPMIVKHASPKLFGSYLSRLLRSGRVGASEELMVVNAWNEWGEGAMLEPTEEEGYGYLEALQQAMSAD